MEDVCDQLGPIPLVTLPKDRLGQKKKKIGSVLAEIFQSLSTFSFVWDSRRDLHFRLGSPSPSQTGLSVGKCPWPPRPFVSGTPSPPPMACAQGPRAALRQLL